ASVGHLRSAHPLAAAGPGGVVACAGHCGPRKETVMSAPKALLFDVFGTVVDWRGGLIRELIGFGRRRGISADWADLADAWRAAYAPALGQVLKGEVAWARLEVLQRDS